MSAGMPMYFPWRLNMIRVPGWRSPRMDKISCYVIGLISASVNQGIMFWAVDVHICMVILDPSWCGDHIEPTGQAATGGWMIRDVLTVSMVGTWIEVKLKDKSWFKGRHGALGAECEWRYDKEKYGSWHWVTIHETHSYRWIFTTYYCCICSSIFPLFYMYMNHRSSMDFCGCFTSYIALDNDYVKHL